MSKKVLYATIIVLLVIVGAAIYLSGNRGAGGGGYPPNAMDGTPQTDVVFSGGADEAKYGEYFSELYLGKLSAGAKFDPFKVTRTKVYGSGEQLCQVMTLKKQVAAGGLGLAVYDVNAGNEVQPKSSFPQALGPGGVTGCSPLEWPAGKYEYQIYVDDVLVGALPFEVE